MNSITRIGKCKGCEKSPTLVDDGVCNDCLTHPKRGRKWAEMSERIRNDSHFALQAFNAIGQTKPENELAGKLLFIKMYGAPIGANISPELKKLVETSSEPELPRPHLRLVR